MPFPRPLTALRRIRRDRCVGAQVVGLAGRRQEVGLVFPALQSLVPCEGNAERVEELVPLHAWLRRSRSRLLSHALHALAVAMQHASTIILVRCVDLQRHGILTIRGGTVSPCCQRIRLGGCVRVPRMPERLLVCLCACVYTAIYLSLSLSLSLCLDPDLDLDQYLYVHLCLCL